MSSIPDQITFRIEKNEAIADGPSELYSVIETLNDLHADEVVWKPAIDTIDGRLRFRIGSVVTAWKSRWKQTVLGSVNRKTGDIPKELSYPIKTPVRSWSDSWKRKGKL